MKPSQPARRRLYSSMNDTTCRLAPFSLAWLGALCLGACSLSLSGVPVAVSERTKDAGVDVVKGDSSAPPSGDAAAPDAGEAPPLASGVVHPDCGGVAFPAEPPPLVNIAADATGRPAFDFWRDSDCDSLAAPVRCGGEEASGSPWGCDGCIWPVVGPTPGYCNALSASEVSCLSRDPSTIPLAYHGEDCVSCVPPALKAWLCCNQVEGIDCRAWPFETKSTFRQLCARHEDCEPGLVCHPHTGAGYGVCGCPQQEGAASVLSSCGDVQ